ncbi:hypothetical protein B0H17DRAFT_1140785 [Mycena rosella]|uniref:Uncharacterized protein n=1 Tax=Mycena rosella TaxID=1033263 RepID=A0AAD7D1Q6_MYCRO|nr:hypothetical protein B0H17DRAFT_1140785 [Mycena rosella]
MIDDPRGNSDNPSDQVKTKWTIIPSIPRSILQRNLGNTGIELGSKTCSLTDFELERGVVPPETAGSDVLPFKLSAKRNFMWRGFIVPGKDGANQDCFTAVWTSAQKSMGEGCRGTKDRARYPVSVFEPAWNVKQMPPGQGYTHLDPTEGHVQRMKCNRCNGDAFRSRLPQLQKQRSQIEVRELDLTLTSARA